jgi:Fe2+ transport protein
MSGISSGPAAAGPHPRGGMSPSSRAAAIAGAIAVAVVLVIVLAHIARGTPKPAASASGSAGMQSQSSSSMHMSSPSATPVPMGATASVPTVQATSLPVMTSSGAPMAMAMVPLGQATWDGMRIQARTSAPATFILFNGTSQQLVRPTEKDSFHLMVTLADAQSNFAIPYSSVWATIRKGPKIVFDERLWPMISRYMGPHYGDNVPLPASGLYHMTLLVSPPTAARHLEYKGLWLRPHRVQMSFRWVAKQ